MLKIYQNFGAPAGFFSAQFLVSIALKKSVGIEYTGNVQLSCILSFSIRINLNCKLAFE